MRPESWPASERLEYRTLEALHAGAEPRTRAALGLDAAVFGDAFASIARLDPSIMLNRAIGLGLDGASEAAAPAAIRDRYRQAAVERFFVHLHPEARTAALAEQLEGAGLRPHRRWMKFERDRRPPPQAESSLRVREIDAQHVDAFGRIAAAGFDLSPAGARLFAGLVGRPGFHLYMSFAGETPAGTGLLYIEDGDAWLDWGATDPAFRRRGSQRALLARRIADALDAGCRRLLTCTGEAVPGDPQHSYHNIEWAGFRPQYLRENWVPQS